MAVNIENYIEKALWLQSSDLGKQNLCPQEPMDPDYRLCDLYTSSSRFVIKHPLCNHHKKYVMTECRS